MITNIIICDIIIIIFLVVTLFDVNNNNKRTIEISKILDRQNILFIHRIIFSIT